MAGKTWKLRRTRNIMAGKHLEVETDDEHFGGKQMEDVVGLKDVSHYGGKIQPSPSDWN